MKISYPYSDFYPHSCGQYKHVQISDEQKIITILSELPDVTNNVIREPKKKKEKSRKIKINSGIYIDRCIIQNADSYTIRMFVKGNNTVITGFKTLEEARIMRDKIRVANPKCKTGPKQKQ